MNSSGLGLCCAQGNTEWVPDCGTRSKSKGETHHHRCLGEW